MTNREIFEARLAQQTGLDPRVIHAWVSAESGNERTGTAPSLNNQNWLNIAYFDSGPGKLATSKYFNDPVSAADMTAQFLKGKWGGASPGIRSILRTAGQSPQAQISAIGHSGWATNPRYLADIEALYSHPGPYTAPDPNSVGSIISQVTGAVGDTASTVANAGLSTGEFLSKLTDPHLWLRVALGVGAMFLLFFGLFELAGGNGHIVTRPARRIASRS